MNRRIDKLPPSYSGEVKEDLKQIMQYLSYLHEQVDFYIAKLEKISESARTNK